VAVFAKCLRVLELVASQRTDQHSLHTCEPEIDVGVDASAKLTPERLGGGASEAVVVARKRRFDRFVDSAGWIFCLLVMLSPAAAPPHLAASP